MLSKRVIVLVLVIVHVPNQIRLCPPLLLISPSPQAIDFIENVVGEPVYVAGNSLGGYLSLMLACKRPDLVKGIFLINPTPW